jgi:hypothetical protein
MANFEFRMVNSENRTVDDGNGRWMSSDDGEKIYWSVNSCPLPVVGQASFLRAAFGLPGSGSWDADRG